MTTISINVEGLQEALRNIEKAPSIIAPQIGAAIRDTIRDVHSAAVKEAPVNKQTGGGNLRQSIRSKMTGQLRGEINVGAKYAVYVHEGTRPHVIRPKTKKILANTRTNQVFGRLVHHPGTKANPFLKRAIEKNKNTIEGHFDRAVKNIIAAVSKW